MKLLGQSLTHLKAPNETFLFLPSSHSRLSLSLPPSTQQHGDLISLHNRATVKLPRYCFLRKSEIFGACEKSVSKIGSVMEDDDWESSSSEGLSGNELCLDEEIYDINGSLPKLQFRKKASKARWNDEVGMAEVTEKKGQIWVNTGIVRSSKTYCFLEEALYLAEIGALLLLDTNGTSLSLEDIYRKVTEEKGGCYMELCMVYRHLKFLGYILRRHNVPWTLKNLRGSGELGFCNGNREGDGIADEVPENENSIFERFGSMRINEVRPMFDVYLPNSTFRKTSPGDPEFVLCSTGVCPPTKVEIEVLEAQCGNIPLRFCHVEPARITFFSFDKVNLPQLP